MGHDIGRAIFPLVNARCYCRFHEEDKVLIAEIQLILTLTLTLTLIKIISKGRNQIEKRNQKLNIKIKNYRV